MASKMLLNPVLNDWVRCGTHEMWPAGVNASILYHPQKEKRISMMTVPFQMIDAIQKWPGSSEPAETVGSLNHHPMFLN